MDEITTDFIQGEINKLEDIIKSYRKNDTHSLILGFVLTGLYYSKHVLENNPTEPELKILHDKFEGYNGIEWLIEKYKAFLFRSF